MEIRLLPTVFLLLAMALPVSAGAAMYAYVDARGICHYTNVPGDGRYKLSQRSTGRHLGSAEDRLQSLHGQGLGSPRVGRRIARGARHRCVPVIFPVRRVRCGRPRPCLRRQRRQRQFLTLSPIAAV